MLKLVVVGDEFFDDESQTFTTIGTVVLELEHSLVSLSKWESIFEKPFLVNEQRTDAEIIGYIECMILTPDFPPEVLSKLSPQNHNEIHHYINRKFSATWFSDKQTAARNNEIVTSELIYYWMVAYNIPFEAETWNLNRLFNLIRICNIKNSKPKKMSRNEIIARNKQLNEARKAQLGTRG